MRNLVFEMVRFDNRNLIKERDPNHLKLLVLAMRSCGLTFDVWETRDGDGKPQGRYDWIALTGREKKHLTELPPKLRVLLLPEDIRRQWRQKVQNQSAHSTMPPY